MVEVLAPFGKFIFKTLSKMSLFASRSAISALLASAAHEWYIVFEETEDGKQVHSRKDQKQPWIVALIRSAKKK